ncbi:hypothetical protein [Pseudescherichia vulneris]|uniref:hypothetical protein n=2 Tax=Pseudescherichia TaxID=2055880 RepID=UPI0028AEDDD4|nr:hypothetical protein [Pseudescherichia vulneris]
MHTQNVNVKTAAQESSRKMGEKTSSYIILVSEKERDSEEEWDVMDFEALADLKEFRRRYPEKMKCQYRYGLSSGVDEQFRYVLVTKADHFKQFVRQLERLGIAL